MARGANMGHQLAGGNSGWCPELDPPDWVGMPAAHRLPYRTSHSVLPLLHVPGPSLDRRRHLHSRRLFIRHPLEPTRVRSGRVT